MITFAEILRLHLRDEQLGEDVDLRNIASKTDYYSGSDLKGEFLYSQCQQSHQSIILCVSSLCVGCNGVRQRFHRQLRLDFTCTLRIQWCQRHLVRWSSIETPYSNYHVEQLCTCDQRSPAFVISRQSFRTTALAWPIQPQEDIGQAQWYEATNQWALRRDAYL